MKKLNIRYIKQCIVSVTIFGFLTYVLITTKDLITKIVSIPFLVFSLAFFIEKVLLIFNKKVFAKKFSKIYVIAFFVYWFGFLIYWDYVSIINKDYMSIIFSLLMWFGGGYISYKRLFKNEHNEKQ